jgi:hypothetical protein
LWGSLFTVGSAHAEWVYYDSADQAGRLAGGIVWLDTPERPYIAPPGLSDVVTIIDHGDPANRIDLACVGDGYLESELYLYAYHLESGAANFFAWEPFTSYATFFNVHRVDVISPESGVDHDPAYGIWRNTAMDMGFWCGGIERLLCVDVGKAWMFAADAPGADQVVAIANSTMYGGAGYPGSDLATFSGGNSWAPEVALHELGHSLGDLADEYDYFDYGCYQGGEPEIANVSILNAGAMASAGTKWAAWLGHPGIGYGGLVDTYEGAHYHPLCIYRPTADSKMRSLMQPFNLPSAEALILSFYRTVHPIDDSTPTNIVLHRNDTVFVDPVDPASHALSVQWYLDGEAIAEATGDSLQLAALGLTPGYYDLSVRVVDPTGLVRNEAAREQWMTQRLSWVIDAVTAVSDADAARSPGISLHATQNPFGSTGAIRFYLDAPARIDLEIVDIAGRIVRRLAEDAEGGAGWHSYAWPGRDESGRNVPSGVYFCRLRTANAAATTRLVLVR